MMNTHPKIFVWMMEQDRQKAQMQRAFERAARSGGEQRPGLARGGITSFARFLRKAAQAVQLRPDRSGRASI